MQTILGIETTGPFCSLCVWQEGQVLSSSHDNIGYGHAGHLFPALDALLKEANLTLQDISHVAFTRGPGSFTGVRVGLSVAQSLVLAGSIIPLGLKTFEVAAHKYPQSKAGGASGEQRLFLMDTKRQDFYGALYKDDRCIMEDILSLEDVLALAKENADLSIWSNIDVTCGHTIHTLEYTAEDVIQAALTLKTINNETFFSSSPCYLRPPKVYENKKSS